MSSQDIHRNMYNAIAAAAADDAAPQRPAAELGAGKQPRSRRASYEYLERWLDGRGLAGKRVLDFGCGMGDLSIYLASCGARVTGIDISDRAIQFARAKAANFPLARQPVFHVGDVESLAGAEGGFDYVISQGVLSFVDFNVAVEQMARTIRPDGRIVLCDTMGHNPITNLGRYISFRRGRTSEWQYRHVVEIEMLEGLVGRFARVQLHHFDLFTIPVMFLETAILRHAPRLAPLVWPFAGLALALDRWAMRVPGLRLYGYRFVCILSGPRPEGEPHK